jgi:hypothetical protein
VEQAHAYPLNPAKFSSLVTILGSWSPALPNNVRSEGTTGRTLTTQLTVTGGDAATTVDLCLSTCKAAGFTFAGVEYADQCCKCSFRCQFRT